MTKDHDIRDACRRLIAEFVWHVDRNDYHALVELFAPDGVFERPGAIMVGRQAILAAMELRSRDRLTRHFCTDPIIDIVSPTAANGRCYVSLQSAPRAERGDQSGMRVTLVGEYHDRFVLTGDGWRIAYRTARIISQD